MAQPIAIMGNPGTGKTTSFLPNKELGIKGINPKEIFIISVLNKKLPVKGASQTYITKPCAEGGNYRILNTYTGIYKALEACNKEERIKTIIIDDLGMLISLSVMDQATEKNRDKWTYFAKQISDLLVYIDGMRDDLNVVLIFHTEMNETGQFKIKTAGKMIDNNGLLDGRFSILLHAVVMDDGTQSKFMFRTKSCESSTCRSPFGMFEEEYIPNDLGYVLDKIKEYN